MTRPSTPSVICYVAVLALAFALTWESGTRTDRGSKTSGASSAVTNNLTKLTVKGVSNRQSIEIVESYGKLPLTFEANYGQSANHVKFQSLGSGYTIFLTPDEAVLALKKPRKQSAGSQKLASQNSRNEVTSSASHEAVNAEYLRMKLLGANSKAAVSGTDELPGKSNYFIGNDPSKWRTNVPTYAKVKCEQVYPGVDLIYYGNESALEYDFVVRPGVDPKVIRLGFGKIEKARVDDKGTLVLKMSTGDLRLKPPIVYQERGGEKESVEGHYALLANNTVGFEIGAYDGSRELVIDPVLVYSTYFGADSGDAGRSITVDSAGNAYVVGRTDSTSFPTSGPLQGTFGGGSYDAFVTKINPSGSAVVYSTYLGGSAYDFATHVAVDSAGNAVVSGVTSSTNFPTLNAAQSKYGGGNNDAFVAKLNPSGSALLYSTYWGGSGDENPLGAGIPIGVALDSAGNAYVVGATTSTDFPTLSALQPKLNGFANAFITKFTAVGTVVYSTYLGGSNVDLGYAIAVDAAGNAYITGSTNSTNFPTVNSLQPKYGGGGNTGDAFVTKINSSGSALVYSTYLGGSKDDSALALALDSSGNAYVTGDTSSTDFPLANAVQSSLRGGANAYISKLNSSGSALMYSTYLGGSGTTVGSGIAVDSVGSAYVTGDTNSQDFPTVAPFQAGFSRNAAFISKISASGNALVYSGPFGDGNAANGFDIAVDSSGSAYVVGFGIDLTIPLVNPIQTSSVAGVFIAKVGPSDVSPAVNLSSSGLTFPNQLVTTPSSAQSVTISNTGNAPLTVFGVNIGGANASDFSESNTCSAAVAVGSNCSVSIKFTPSGTGTRTASATVTDNANSSPQVISLSGSGTDFSLGPASGAPTSATFIAGQSATLNLQVNPVSGFTGAVSLACSGAPAQSTCSTSASSVNVGGASPAPFSVTITTTARGLLPPGTLRRPWPRVRRPPPLPSTILVLLCVLVAVLKASRRNRPRPVYTWATATLRLACLGITLVSMSGCGSGGNPPNPPPATGTPAGTYNLTVTGSSQGQNRTITLVLTLN